MSESVILSEVDARGTATVTVGWPSVNNADNGAVTGAMPRRAGTAFPSSCSIAASTAMP